MRLSALLTQSSSRVRMDSKMGKAKPIEIFTPPNALKAKVGGSLSPMDKGAVAKADAALSKLSDEFQNWIEDELRRLEEAWATFSSASTKVEAVTNVHAIAHDLKGLAKTYEYPLVGRMAASLCRLTNDEVDRQKSPENLIRAHIDGVRAAIKGHIKTEEHPVGLALVTEMETQVSDFESKNSLLTDDDA